MSHKPVSLLLALLAYSSEAFSTDYYAAPGAPASGTCTQATPCDVNYAISSSSGDDIRILLTPGTYGPAIFLQYGKSLQIIGSGNQTTTVQRASFYSCTVEFEGPTLGTPATVTLDSLTMDATNGGYGICAQSVPIALTLNINRSNIINGSLSGVYITGMNNNMTALTITESTIQNNAGGVVFPGGYGSVDVVRSLVAYNSGGYGEIYTGHPITTIVNSTIVGRISGGAAHVIQATTLQLSNSTVVEGGESGATIDAESIVLNYSVVVGTCGGTSLSGDYSVESPGGTCNLTPGNSKNVADAGLGFLADNGGPTLTALPVSGSPVIGIGGPECQPVDQRDFVRSGACDAGATQLDASIPDVIFAYAFEVFSSR